MIIDIFTNYNNMKQDKMAISTMKPRYQWRCLERSYFKEVCEKVKANPKIDIGRYSVYVNFR